MCIISISLTRSIFLGFSYIYSDVTTDNYGIFGKYAITDKRHISFGLKYHVNNDTTKPLFRFYYQNLYSENFFNKLGFTFEYRFQFTKNRIVNPYLFYNFQYSRLGSKFKEFYFYTTPANMMEKQTTFDPINFFENHFQMKAQK